VRALPSLSPLTMTRPINTITNLSQTSTPVAEAYSYEWRRHSRSMISRALLISSRATILGVEAVTMSALESPPGAVHVMCDFFRRGLFGEHVPPGVRFTGSTSSDAKLIGLRDGFGGRGDGEM
jgi:hypothetical protein